MNQAHEKDIKVYFEDTDAGGVVFYANYLRFMERGRTDWIAELGYGQRQLAEVEKIGFVVRNLELSYRRPGRLDDILCVRTSLLSLRRAALWLRQDVVFRNDGETAVSGKVELACIGVQSMRPQRIPAELLEKLQRLAPST